MTDKRATPEGSEATPDSPRPKKRAVPTIDLTATEVPPVTAAEPPKPEPQPAPEQTDSSSNSSADSRAWLRTNINVPAFAAGVAGAAIMTLLVFGLWLTGVLPSRYSEVSVVRADTKSIDALNDRLGKLEDSIAKFPPADASASDRVAAVESAMKAVGVTLTALSRRSDDNAATAALARDRVDALEKAVTEWRASVDAAKTSSAGISSADLDALLKRVAGIEQAAKTAATDRPARLALSAAALRDTAISGAPLADALAQAKSLGGDTNTLAPLEPFAATGVPTQAALAQELRVLLPALLKDSGAQAPEGGFLDRLQANAGKLVRIRPVDAPPGEDSSAVLARIEIEAAHNDTAGALNDLAKLPDATRAPAQAWIAKANARQAALTAANAFALDTARALGQP
ncbi:MAG TPA: hypothetical protein VGC38_01935 [Pseudolabrys sp.]